MAGINKDEIRTEEDKTESIFYIVKKMKIESIKTDFKTVIRKICRRKWKRERISD